MTIEELEALKRQWYETALTDGSIALCGLVGRTLGMSLDARYGPKYRWGRAGIEVYVDDYGKYLTVCADGKRVCSTHDCDQLFVPGPWMEIVRAGAVEAKARTERDEFRREERLQQHLMSELGLSERTS